MQIVVVVAVVIAAMMTDDHDVMMLLIMIAAMVMDDHDVVMILINIMMMMKHDDPVMTFPIAISVSVSVADADGYALLRNDHWLVAVRSRRRRRRAQDCKRACDKNQFVHVMFLHCRCSSLAPPPSVRVFSGATGNAGMPLFVPLHRKSRIARSKSSWK